MEILVISDIHEAYKNVRRVNEIKRDLTIICGDFTNWGGVEKAKRILDMLSGKIVAVPGNMDNQDIIKLLEEKNVSVHGQIKEINGVKIGGFGGGNYGPFGTPMEFSELEFEQALDKLGCVDILVTHAPAKDTKVDHGYGVEAIREYIESCQPIFALSGHIHEARGTDVIGKTILVNPGPLKYGYYAKINWETKNVKLGQI